MKTTLLYGGQKINLTKSNQLLAIKSKRNAPAVKKRVLDKATNLSLRQVNAMGDFVLLRNGKHQLEATNQALDTLRQQSSTEVGSHVYHINDAKSEPLIPTGNLYVVFAPTLPVAECHDIMEVFSLKIVQKDNEYEYILGVTEKSPNPIKVAAALQNEYKSKVLIAEPDFERSVARYEFNLPKDRFFADQWHLQNQGPEHFYWVSGDKGIFSQDKFIKGADAKVVEAWQYLGNFGSPNITIAIIDDGFDINHPDIQGNGARVSTRAQNFVDNNGNVLPVASSQSGREEEHGTFCAGVALGAANGKGVSGAAPNAKFLPIKAIHVANDMAAEQWLTYAANNGADIISCSWGWKVGTPISSRMQGVLRKIATEGRNGKGVILCFAAGNANPDSNNVAAPVSNFAADPNVICVAASTSFDTLANYSFYGPNVTIAAPSGGDEYAAITTCSVSPDLAKNPEQVFFDDNGNAYTSWFSGTSSACPLVAGICALILSANPNLTAQRVKEIIKMTADKITDPAFDPEGYNNGHSKRFGAGRINTLKAVKQAKADLLAPPPTTTKTTSSTPPLPQPVPTVQQKATVIPKTLNIRDRPDATGVLLGQLTQNEQVTIFAKVGNWAQIAPGKYVSLDFLQLIPPPQMGKVVSDTLNVRKGASVFYGVVRKLKKDDTITILERKGDWLRIGEGEFVMQKYVVLM